MMLSFSGTAMVCFSSGVNEEKIRTELDQLHSEAETAIAKEAAKKLRRQAAINVQKGKEDNARELFFQKKTVVEALEKSNNRIEVLDEFSTKLNQAITVKETQLIGNISLDLEVDQEDEFTSVHIVSPTAEAILKYT